MTQPDQSDVVQQFGVRVVAPEPHHRGTRLRVNGVVVDENSDDQGHYAIIELTSDDEETR